MVPVCGEGCCPLRPLGADEKSSFLRNTIDSVENWDPFLLLPLVGEDSKLCCVGVMLVTAPGVLGLAVFELGWDLLQLGTHPSHGKLFPQRAGVVMGLLFPVCYTLSWSQEGRGAECLRAPSCRWMSLSVSTSSAAVP